MTERWWDPDGPAVPLLTPGTDPRLDVANAFIAMHRSGAAALQAAGATPLLDDTTVGRALASARQVYAQPVLDAVGNSLGDPTYAGLLVRDVADDAELATMTLYRTCVAKGVAPPMAAERAAKVYGVPSMALGVYAKLAIDPRAQPVALTDAADRTLLGWAAKIADDELEAIAIAKAESRETRQAAAADEPRNDRGRFARLASRTTPKIAGQDVGDWLAAQMAGATEAETVGPADVATPSKAPKRLSRPTRKKRRSVLVRTKATVTPTTVTRTKPTRAKPAMSRAAVMTRAVTRGDVKRMLEQPRRTARTERPVPTEMTHIDGPVKDHALGEDIAYAMPYDEWMDFQRGAGTGPERGSRVFTARAFETYAGTGVAYSSEDYDNMVQGVRDKMAANPNIMATPDDVVMAMDPEDVMDVYAEIADPVLQQERLNELKLDYLQDYLAEKGISDVVPRSEIAHIDALPDFHDPNTTLLVWHPPNPDLPHAPRGGIGIAEVVVDSDASFGHRLGESTRYGASQVSLDPNLPLIARGDAGIDNAAYDQELGLTRIYRGIDRTDPDSGFTGHFSKADAWQGERRNSRGEWTKTAEPTRIAGQSVDEWLANQVQAAQDEAVAPTKSRAQRPTRAKRRVVGTRSAVTVSRPALRRTTATRALVQRKAIERSKVQLAAVKRTVPKTEQSLPLMESEHYSILSSADLRRRLGVDDAHMQRKLDFAETKWLRGQSSVDGDAVLMEVSDRTNSGTYLEGRRIWAHTFMATDDGMRELQHRVAQAYADPDIDTVYLDMEKVTGPGGEDRIEVTASDHTDLDREELHVMRWGDTSPGNLHEIAYSGARRLLNDRELSHMVAMSWRGLLDTSTPRAGFAENQVWIANPRLGYWEIRDTGDQPEH